MALWSFIIILPFFIMYFSPCPIDCSHWMFSLNQFFQEEKWFVYEQPLPILTITALAAALKLIRKKPKTTSVHGAGNAFSACPSYSIRDERLFPSRTADTRAAKHNIFWHSFIFPLIKDERKKNSATPNMKYGRAFLFFFLTKQ